MLWKFSFKVGCYKALKDKESWNHIKYVSVNFHFVSENVCLGLVWGATFYV